MLSYEILLEEKIYSLDEIEEAVLIVHPKGKGYNHIPSDIARIFEVGSNFTQLENPIYDEYGNEFRDSEGYYMAARTQDQAIKKYIAFLSIGYGLSRKSRRRFDLDHDKKHRIDYMRDAISKKFDANPHLKDLLYQTKPKEIIEYTYRKDMLFGIDQETLTGANVLGKLLMEYRDAI